MLQGGILKHLGFKETQPASQQTNGLRIYDEDRGYLSWRWFWLTVWKSPRYGKGTIISSTTHRPIWGRERKHKESGKRNLERITAAPTPSVMQSQWHSQAHLQPGRLDALSFSWCFSFFVWIYTFRIRFSISFPLNQLQFSLNFILWKIKNSILINFLLSNFHD